MEGGGYFQRPAAEAGLRKRPNHRTDRNRGLRVRGYPNPCMNGSTRGLTRGVSDEQHSYRRGGGSFQRPAAAAGLRKRPK